MPPNPTGYAAQLLARGADRVGYTAYPYPAAVNSEEFDGRPACNSCSACSGFGCPIDARGDALVSWLNPAMRSGKVRLISRAWVYRIDATRNGKRATRVRYRDVNGKDRAESADIVVLAGSPINTARLLLMSAQGTGAHSRGLGNRSDQVGRNMMFHNFTLGAALYPHDIQPLRAQSTTLQADAMVGPFTSPEITAMGVPYIKGGLIQLGSAAPLLPEAAIYSGLVGYGRIHKELMRQGFMHAKIAGSQLVHEDLPQADNRVDLAPGVKDFQGFPAARITYSPHRHEQVAAAVLGPKMQAFHALAPGAIGSAIIPYPLISDVITYTAHLAGTARMGTGPETSVCDASGRIHDLDNVYVADASTWPTYPGFNPSLTILANALRIARGITGGMPPLSVTPVT